jgi:hypothetical protein
MHKADTLTIPIKNPVPNLGAKTKPNFLKINQGQEISQYPIRTSITIDPFRMDASGSHLYKTRVTIPDT